MTPKRLLQHLEEALAGGIFGCHHLGTSDTGLAALAKRLLGAKVSVVEADGKRTLSLVPDGTGRKSDWLQFTRILREKAAKQGKSISILPHGRDAAR
jgi:hypothetical protein